MPKPPPKTIKKNVQLYYDYHSEQARNTDDELSAGSPRFYFCPLRKLSELKLISTGMSLNRTVFKMEFCNPNRMSYSVPIWTDIDNH